MVLLSGINLYASLMEHNAKYQTLPTVNIHAHNNIMERHVFVRPKTNNESLGIAHNEGARKKNTCTRKRKCQHSCDYIVNIV